RAPMPRKKKQQRRRSPHAIPPKVPAEVLRKYVLGQVDHETREIARYVEREASNETVTHLEKIKTEHLFGRQFDCWDVHTDKGRWWVITTPTNLYSQELFPSIDYTLSFHVGLMLRVQEKRGLDAGSQRTGRLASSWRRLEQALVEVDRAGEAEDFQAIGMRCRECLLAFLSEVAEAKMVPADREKPKDGDFINWSEVIADHIARGGSAKEVRSHLKVTARTAWQLVGWLTHARNAVRFDGHLAIDATRAVLDAYFVALVRHESGAPDRCPQCKSYRLASLFRPELGADHPYVTLCESCGWHSPSNGDTPLPLH
ncbi:MAG: hypothetical protein ACREA0_09065, partial [bacterium]